MNIKQTIETMKMLMDQEKAVDKYMDKVGDMLIQIRQDTIKECIEEVNKEIAAVQSHPEMYAQQMRILSLQDARDRLVKLLSDVE